MGFLKPHANQNTFKIIIMYIQCYLYTRNSTCALNGEINFKLILRLSLWKLIIKYDRKTNQLILLFKAKTASIF